MLSGIGADKNQVEIATGRGGGDCGYAFDVGATYMVYAYRDEEGRLATGICSRTRPLADAADDLEYIHVMKNAPETSKLRVLTRLGGAPGRPAVAIVAAKEGVRYSVFTNAAGDAIFPDLPPGAYTIHEEQDGDLADDPKVQLYAKGCLDVTLLRTLHATGRITTSTGAPAARIEVHLRSTGDVAADGTTTDQDGRYDLKISRPGQYYLGINLNHSPTRDTPYPRWFYPGTEDPLAATRIEFAGRPEVRTYSFALPEREDERVIEGVVLRADGQPAPRAVVTILDSARNAVAQSFADQSGRFSMSGFAKTAYRMHVVVPGKDAISAVPLDIAPGTGPLTLNVVLTQPGNSFLNERR